MKKNVKGLAALAFALTTVVATADLPWPDDFAAAVADREAEVSPEAVKVSAAGLDLLGGARLASPAFGSEEVPFDSWRAFSLPSAAIPFDTLTPGFLLFFR